MAADAATGPQSPNASHPSRTEPGLPVVPSAVDGGGPFLESHEGDLEGLSADASTRQHARRKNVCAVPVQLQDARNFEARVIEKSDTEMEELRRGVANNSLFTTLEPRDLDKIVKALDRQDFDAGADILKQGEISPSRFYLIFEGQIAVIKNGKNVAKMGVGQSFGELEMMYETSEPNAAAIRAVTDVSLWWLDRPTYKNIVLRATLEKRDLYLSLLGKVSFLEGLSEYDRNTLADALKAEKYRNDDFIIRFGETGNWMHFIVEGTVQVVGRQKGSKVNIVQLGPGECVGELEFLFNHRCVADVVAVGQVTTAKLSRKHFEMLMGPIANDLKMYVTKGGYEHYLTEADEHVKTQLAAANKRQAKKKTNQGDEAASGATLNNVDPSGELILCGEPEDAESDDPIKKMPTMYRFPLRGAELATQQLSFGIREDFTIVSWNHALGRSHQIPCIRRDWTVHLLIS